MPFAAIPGRAGLGRRPAEQQFFGGVGRIAQRLPVLRVFIEESPQLRLRLGITLVGERNELGDLGWALAWVSCRW